MQLFTNASIQEQTFFIKKKFLYEVSKNLFYLHSSYHIFLKMKKLLRMPKILEQIYICINWAFFFHSHQIWERGKNQFFGLFQYRDGPLRKIFKYKIKLDKYSELMSTSFIFLRSLLLNIFLGRLQIIYYYL